ncbi:Ig-like domain-containing protein, partial [Vibrio sp. 10N.261.49.A3]|uniref:Ig-like domain-containing protein n=1 Tax=Vibrio sp. 10N.261.49.A3 TaxID=3229669 RepID=UPI00354FF8BB
MATSPTDLVDGEYTWEVVARNNIGNSSISDKHKIVIDREIEIESAKLLNTSDTGISNSDGITNDRAPTFDGTAEKG